MKIMINKQKGKRNLICFAFDSINVDDFFVVCGFIEVDYVTVGDNAIIGICVGLLGVFIQPACKFGTDVM